MPTRHVRVSVRPPRSIAAAPLRPGLKCWLRLGDDFLMGPRHVHLLEDVERLGSIRAACVEVGLSYRTCMNRLRRMEAVLGGKVLETHRGGAAGGGAQLTPRARRLLRVYRQWRTDLVRISDRAFQRALRV